MERPAAQSFSQWPAIGPAEGLALVELEAHACVYLGDRSARMRGFWAEELSPEAYQGLMDAGFRRSGRVVYQPICGACRACVALRVPTEAFAASKGQRRCARKNGDVRVTVGPPVPTREKFEMYGRYQREWHGKSGAGEADDVEAFIRFLYDSPVDTREFAYRDAAGALLAVGICDVSATSLSSVYFYFEPAAAARGLGTFGALYEIAWARERGIAFWYAGFWVGGCGKMEYKKNFRPHELLGGDGVWRREGAAGEGD